MAETQKTILARIDERTKVLPEMREHLAKLNDSISATNIKLAKTDEIAKNANSKADNNRRYLDKATIAIGVAVITGLGSIIAVTVFLI